MTTPEAKADRLIKALRENTNALRKVKRSFRWSVALTILLVFTLGFVVYSAHQGDVEACQNANRIRLEIDEKFGSIGDFLEGVISDTPSNREFIELVEEDLTPRDCSEIGWFG